MKIKNRVLALILAGLLTASLASCISRTGQQTTPNGSEPQQTQDPLQGDASLVFEDRNESVYVTASNLNLRKSTTSTTGAIQVPRYTKLHRIKYNATWSVVMHEGQEYYASSQYLTDEDLMAENYTACAEKTMYATASLNVRAYPSPENDYSEILVTLAKNTPVTVVATSNNTSWVKIKNPAEGKGGEFAFVLSKYLSDTLGGSTNIDYTKFVDYAAPQTMYVTGDTYLRQEPTLEGSIIRTMKKGEEITAVAVANAPALDPDITWVKIKYADAVKPGDVQTYSYGYASVKNLSMTPDGASLSLSEMLALYTGFSARSMNVYASGQVYVRTSPALDSTGANLSPYTLQKRDPVTVVAVANAADADGIVWYMIHRKGSENQDLYLFVSGKYLTSDPDGNAGYLTLEDLLKYYPDFTTYSATKTVSNASGANCYGAPDQSGTIALTLSVNQSVSVVAKGEARGAEWYVIRTESGLFYFVGAALFA